MNSLVVVLHLLWLLVACGKPQSGFDTKEEVFQTTFSNQPIFLKKQNSHCKEKKFSNRDLNFDLHLFQFGNKEIVKKDFSPILQGLFLRSRNVISKSVYGERVEVINSRHNSQYHVHNVAKNIEICPEDETYQTDTIESAALNTSYFIYKTHLRFSTVLPDIHIAPIILNISPAIIRSEYSRSYEGKIIKNSSYMTDNAFYVPLLKTVTFLPHSLSLRMSGLNFSYWEVPMVASHEYGHHLFQMISGIQSGTMSTTHECFGQYEEKSNGNKSINNRKVTVNDVINAYNEAFADLISYYTLDPNERRVQGVRCLEVTRDVGSEKFYNGKFKVFSSEVLNSYFSSYEDFNRGGPCENHSYQDTHIMGAIFAHNVDYFLSKLTDSDDEKLRMIVRWVKLINKDRKNYSQSSSKKYFNDTFTSFIRLSLEKFNRKFDSNICKRIKLIYPNIQMNECPGR